MSNLGLTNFSTLLEIGCIGTSSAIYSQVYCAMWTLVLAARLAILGIFVQGATVQPRATVALDNVLADGEDFPAAQAEVDKLMASHQSDQIVAMIVTSSHSGWLSIVSNVLEV